MNKVFFRLQSIFLYGFANAMHKHPPFIGAGNSNLASTAHDSQQNQVGKSSDLASDKNAFRSRKRLAMIGKLVQSVGLSSSK